MSDFMRLTANEKFRIRFPLSSLSNTAISFTLIDSTKGVGAGGAAANVLVKAGNVELVSDSLERGGVLAIHLTDAELSAVDNPIEIVVKAAPSGFAGKYSLSFASS